MFHENEKKTRGKINIGFLLAKRKSATDHRIRFTLNRNKSIFQIFPNYLSFFDNKTKKKNLINFHLRKKTCFSISICSLKLYLDQRLTESIKKQTSGKFQRLHEIHIKEKPLSLIEAKTQFDLIKRKVNPCTKMLSKS